MENKTSFDLNAAREQWRLEMAAQPDLPADARRELETHLNDVFAELKERGLNDQEAFWLARHRLGSPGQIASEAVKADPTLVWRGRIFWMVLAVLFFDLLRWLAYLLRHIAFALYIGWSGSKSGIVDWNSEIIGLIDIAIPLALFCCFIFFLCRIRHPNRYSKIIAFFERRRWLMVIPLAVIGCNTLTVFEQWQTNLKHLAQASSNGSAHYPIVSFPLGLNLLTINIWPLMLTALVWWLFPKPSTMNDFQEPEAGPKNAA